MYALCSVGRQRILFPAGQGFFSYFCAPRILPRMRITPRGSPAFPATEDILAQTPATGATPHTHVPARTPPATCAVPSALQIPAAGLGNARDWPLTCLSLPDPPLPRKRRAAAGHTHAGGNILVLPARHAHRRSCQRRRRSRKRPTRPSRRLTGQLPHLRRAPTASYSRRRSPHVSPGAQPLLSSPPKDLPKSTCSVTTQIQRLTTYARANCPRGTAKVYFTLPPVPQG